MECLKYSVMKFGENEIYGIIRNIGQAILLIIK